jgi:hypothetical protein
VTKEDRSSEAIEEVPLFTEWQSAYRSCCERLVASLLKFLPCILAASYAGLALGVGHSPKWTGPATLTYNLVDLDNFPLQDYGYCKWGKQDGQR